MEFNLKKLIRKNIGELIPYSSARNEFYGTEALLLDANENPYNFPYNRYPDPLQRDLKAKISDLFGLPDNYIFLGNGSDEAIDILLRAFCIPGKDNVISIDPTYGMYEVCANINDIRIKKVSLNNDFSLNPDAIISEIDENTKLIFLCSPNNPSGNLLDENQILKITRYFSGLVVVDEAYIDFSGSKGLIHHLNGYKNLVILRTFSKARAMAGLRLGIALADPEIVDVLNKIKYPYNINVLTQKYILKSFNSEDKINRWVDEINEQKKWLISELLKFSFIQKVFPSDANFLLVKVTDPLNLYLHLKQHGLIVRDRSKANLCAGCLRITIGKERENKKLIKILNLYK